jgi:ABC-type transport system substrate-binding protein
MNDTTVGTPAGEKGRALRRALALSVPREDFIRRYLNGRGAPAKQLVPPGMQGHEPANEMSHQRYDPEAARAILREAGFEVRAKGTAYEAADPGTGKPVTVVISFRSTAETMKQMANFIASCASQVGINVQPDLMTFAEFLKRTNEGIGQAYHAGWLMDYPDAQNMLQLLYGPLKPPGVNNAAYARRRYDELYGQMAQLSDLMEDELARKKELIRQMHEQLDTDVPWVLLEFRVTYLLNHEWYTPPKPNQFAYTYIKFAHSDSELRGSKAKEWSDAPFWPGFIMVMLALVPVGLVGWKIVKQM